MPELTHQELDAIAEKIAIKLIDEKRAMWVDPEIHHEDHQWIKSKRFDEVELKKLRRKIIESAVIYAVPIVCGFVALVFWDGLKEALKRALG